MATLCLARFLRPNKYQSQFEKGPHTARGTRHGHARVGEGRPGYMCRFMCSARWSEREKARSHRWHWNGRWPVCLR